MGSIRQRTDLDPYERALAVIAAVDSLVLARYGFVDHEVVIEQGLVIDDDGAVRLDAKVRDSAGRVVVHRPRDVFFDPADSDVDLLDRLEALLDMDRRDLVLVLADQGLVDPDDFPEVLFPL